MQHHRRFLVPLLWRDCATFGTPMPRTNTKRQHPIFQAATGVPQAKRFSSTHAHAERARAARGSVIGVRATAVRTLRSPWSPVSVAHRVVPRAWGSYIDGGGSRTSTKTMVLSSAGVMWLNGESKAT